MIFFPKKTCVSLSPWPTAWTLWNEEYWLVLSVMSMHEQRKAIVPTKWQASEQSIGGLSTRQNIENSIPIGSMYGIFTYIWLNFMLPIDKYTMTMDPIGLWINHPQPSPTNQATNQATNTPPFIDLLDPNRQTQELSKVQLSQVQVDFGEWSASVPLASLGKITWKNHSRNDFLLGCPVGS